MSWINDIINGVFECGAGLLLLLNCRRLWQDKKVRGVSMLPVSFFTLWGIWNLYYYPSLGQMASFLGGLVVVGVNATWVGMAIYYTKKEQDELDN